MRMRFWLDLNNSWQNFMEEKDGDLFLKLMLFQLDCLALKERGCVKKKKEPGGGERALVS